MDISIIIPTHNRAASLARTVHSALSLEYPAKEYEIIVVDNASQDSTRQSVESLRKEAPEISLRYVEEAKLGLHNARHAGARAAEGRILVYTDDDAIFDPKWINAYVHAFETHSEMVAAGGPVRPSWGAPPPEWLINYISCKKRFGMLSLMEPFDDFHLDTDVYFFGVNMAIRRDVLFQVGGFNPELMGNFTIGDGESGLLRKLKERNYLIGYVPDALVYHCIPRQRMTLDYLRRWQAHLAGALLYPRYHKLMPGPFGLLADVLAMLPSCLSTLARDVFSRFTTEGDSISLQLKSALSRAKVRYVVYLLLKPELRRIVTRENWLNPKSEGLEVI